MKSLATTLRRLRTQAIGKYALPNRKQALVEWQSARSQPSYSNGDPCDFATTYEQLGLLGIELPSKERETLVSRVIPANNNKPPRASDVAKVFLGAAYMDDVDSLQRCAAVFLAGAGVSTDQLSPSDVVIMCSALQRCYQRKSYTNLALEEAVQTRGVDVVQAFNSPTLTSFIVAVDGHTVTKWAEVVPLFVARHAEHNDVDTLCHVVQILACNRAVAAVPPKVVLALIDRIARYRTKLTGKDARRMCRAFARSHHLQKVCRTHTRFIMGCVFGCVSNEALDVAELASIVHLCESLVDGKLARGGGNGRALEIEWIAIREHILRQVSKIEEQVSFTSSRTTSSTHQKRMMGAEKCADLRAAVARVTVLLSTAGNGFCTQKGVM